MRMLLFISGCIGLYLACAYALLAAAAWECRRHIRAEKRHERKRRKEP